MIARLDHIVVLAPDLVSGVQWCARTLGITPGPGGQHPLMGTHNRLFAIGGARTAAGDGAGDAAPGDEWPQAYFEIIAIDPLAQPVERARWFDMDEPAVRQRLREQGPFLAHWVVRVDDVGLAAARWAHMGIERGPALAAQRMTGQGLLSWRITVRPDGQRLFDGCLPTLIQWDGPHPAQHMPDSGVKLRAVRVEHPQARAIFQALNAIGMGGIEVAEAPACLCVELDTPLGRVTLRSQP